MRITDFKKLKDGNTYYIYTLSVGNFYSIYRKGKVEEVTYTSNKSEDDLPRCIYHGTLGVFNRKNGGVRSVSSYPSDTIKVFDNIEEAKKEYDKDVKNLIDGLDSFYQERRDALVNLLYNKN